MYYPLTYTLALFMNAQGMRYLVEKKKLKNYVIWRSKVFLGMLLMFRIRVYSAEIQLQLMPQWVRNDMLCMDVVNGMFNIKSNLENQKLIETVGFRKMWLSYVTCKIFTK